MNKMRSDKKTKEAAGSCAVQAPELPAAAAHHYICDMLKELTELAEEAELKELTALLRVTKTAAKTHERFL